LDIDYSILDISFLTAAKICKYAVYAMMNELIFPFAGHPFKTTNFDIQQYHIVHSGQFMLRNIIN